MSCAVWCMRSIPEGAEKTHGDGDLGAKNEHAAKAHGTGPTRPAFLSVGCATYDTCPPSSPKKQRRAVLRNDKTGIRILGVGSFFTGRTRSAHVPTPGVF